MGNAVYLASPVSLPPWLESYEGYIFPGLCQVLSCPHLLKCTIQVQEGEDQFPHFSDSDCVCTVPLLETGPACAFWLRCRSGEGRRSILGNFQMEEQNISVEPASVSSLMQICITFRAWS
ncbi:unnamed protein product [Pipistrellus nathusii]|uniref:Uncharacterized protein n=1 Tax=Pipistrellus nathusii TaxID=59473 RepID=A0ABN9ZFT6_PIPNA